MTNIQTLAYNLKKINKNEALEALERIFENSQNDSIRVDAAYLYKFFEPKQSKNTKKNRLEWVSKAKSKDETRPMFHNIFVRKSTAYATDGHRLHIFKDQSLENLEGRYIDMKRNVLNIDFEFPQIEKVIPEKNIYDVLKVENLTFEREGKTEIVRIKLFDTIFKFNRKFIFDILEDQKICNVYIKEKSYLSPVLFELDNERKAVLMPIR